MLKLIHKGVELTGGQMDVINTVLVEHLNAGSSTKKIEAAIDGALEKVDYPVVEVSDNQQEKFYLITYADGTEQEEYGKDEADVRAFLQRSYSHKGEPVSIAVVHDSSGQ